MLYKELRFSLHVMFHPFDGFWDLKHEKRGSMLSSGIVFLFAVIVTVIASQYTGFIFNYHRVEELNWFTQIFGFIFPFVLWLTANWCVTAILDGEGSFRDILKFSCYALTPYILLTFLLVILSNIASMEESGVCTVISVISTLWTGGLLFFGTLVTHRYSLLKTVGIVLLILLAIAIMLFIGLLMINVVQQMLSFIKIIYGELFIRR